jgi:cell division septum initiation protein DivIVA
MAEIEREEFDHLINDFEVFKDSILEEISKLVQEIEILKEELSELTRDLSGKIKGSRDQKRLV